MFDIRDVYIQTLIEIANHNPLVVVMDADVSKSTRSRKFALKHPDRFFNVGVAEMNLVGMAAGLAAEGKIPFISSFCVFIILRACEPVRTMISYPNLNVKLVGGYAGLTAGQHGPTHHSLRDISVARSLPNFVILSLSDYVSTEKAVKAAAEWMGPVYLRLGYNKQKAVYPEDMDFHIGKAYMLKNGYDLTILSTGLIINEVLKAVEELENDNISVRVIDYPTIKPLDEELILQAAKETGAILTVEDHSVLGGFGGGVAELLAQNTPVPMELVGVGDIFAESAPYEDLLVSYGPAACNIIKATRRLLKRK